MQHQSHELGFDPVTYDCAFLLMSKNNDTSTATDNVVQTRLLPRGDHRLF